MDIQTNECRQTEGHSKNCTKHTHYVHIAQYKNSFKSVLQTLCKILTNTHTTTVYGPFSGTTLASRCQKRTSGLYGARED